MSNEKEADSKPLKTAPPAKRGRKLLAKCLVLFVTIFLLLVLGEIAVRLFCPPLIMPRWVEPGSYGIRKQIGNLRGTIVTAEYHHKLSTNSKGLRGTREYAVPKPANVYRIAVLGDSVVNGYGVEDDQTFCALLEKKLSAKRQAEVLNFGVPGFGNAEELVQLQNEVLPYQPDMVILGYFVNDHFENLTSEIYWLKDGKLVRNPKPPDPAIFLRDHLSKIPGYNFFCQHSYLLNFVRNKLSGMFRKKLGTKMNASDYTGEHPTEDEIALTSALVDEIIKTCSDRGIKIMVLNIPMQRSGVWSPNLVADRLKFKDRAQVVDVAEQIFKGQDVWAIAWKESYHPKPFGHQLIADWLADYVQKKVWENQ